MKDKLQKLRDLKKMGLLGGGHEKIERQHSRGKLTARERIDLLLDPGSFTELNMLLGHAIGAPSEGIVAGHGTIDGRQVCIYSQDATVLGGSIGVLHGYKMYRTVELALEMRVPLMGLHDSPGARTQRPDSPGGAMGEFAEKTGGSIFYPNTQASGVVPQLSAVLGSCAGISVYSPALNDFVFMVDGISHMFITGPRIVKSIMGEDITVDELGGAKVHSQTSGVADFRQPNERECFQTMKKLLSFLPSNCDEFPSVVETGDDPQRSVPNLMDIVPNESRKSYDMHKVIISLADNGDFLEIKKEFAPEIIVGFARLSGQTVGFVANQPMVRAGAMTVDSSNKQARFIRFCDCFNIPIILLVDTPAYLPGSEQEHAGIIRHGAKVLYALCEAVVPRIAVLIRKCYGGGSLGMGIVPGLGTDFVFFWPTVEMGVVGAEQSAELFYADEIKKAADPVKYREQIIKEYREKYTDPFAEVSRSPFFEDVIEPAETRVRLIKALIFLRNKKVMRIVKKHGNIPL